MWQAMIGFQQRGGRLMCMGGNGFYRRCAHHPGKPWLKELRRAETGARHSETPAGERCHSYSSGGGAAGDEIDRVDFRLGTPGHALVVARSEKHTRYYNLVPEETTYPHPTINGEEARHCHADLVFYECLNGGAAFSTGSITWGASLAWDGYDNNVSRITQNVLRRFADPPPFPFPRIEHEA